MFYLHLKLKFPFIAADMHYAYDIAFPINPDYVSRRSDGIPGY